MLHGRKKARKRFTKNLPAFSIVGASGFELTAEVVCCRSLPFISRSIPRILFATDRNFTLQIVGVATRVATCSNGYILS